MRSSTPALAFGAIVLAVALAVHTGPARAQEGAADISRLLALSEQGRQRMRAVGSSEVTVDASALALLARRPSRALIHDVPLPDGSFETFVVDNFDVFTSSAVIEEFDGRVHHRLPIPDVAVFRGASVANARTSILLTVVDGASLRAIVRDDHAVVAVVGAQATGRATGSHEMVDARAIAAARPRSICDGPPLATPADDAPARSATRSPRDANDALLETEMLFDVGNALYAGPFGSSSAAASAYVAELVAAVSDLYERDVKVAVKIGQLVIWTSPDPFDGPDTTHQLNSYTSWSQTNRSGVARDVAQYLSYNPDLGGIAWLGGLCSHGYGYAVSNLDGVYSFPVSSYVWDVNVVAHELGHNFGTVHTHCYSPPLDHCWNNEPGCYSGPIEPAIGETMSYCHLYYSVEMGFRGRVGDVMRTNAEYQACLAPKSPACGDGVVDPGEECDDGNLNGGDCCSSSCLLLSGTGAGCSDGQYCTEDYACADSSCYHQPADCDDGNPCTMDYCDEAAGACAHYDRASPCDDGLFCTQYDSCTGGVCAGRPTDCGNDSACATAACDEDSDACVLTTLPPSNQCATAQSAILTMKRGPKPSLVWKWSKGPALDGSEFGDPEADVSDDYSLCLYDGSGQLIADTRAPASAYCDGKPCWKTLHNGGLKFANSKGTVAGGVSSLALTPGAAGRSKISVKGKGAGLDLPPLPLDGMDTFIAQLRRGTGADCWESTFVPPFKKNGSTQFSDKAP
jgi:cysteine-rich repeat protein